ncbi:hypothetical protein SESBI_31371 [Sesbania bispinosa]|nr:hypothetical protein SESBI_31371 [Sesbania bispinosa]
MVTGFVTDGLVTSGPHRHCKCKRSNASQKSQVLVGSIIIFFFGYSQFADTVVVGESPHTLSEIPIRSDLCRQKDDWDLGTSRQYGGTGSLCLSRRRLTRYKFHLTS